MQICVGSTNTIKVNAVKELIRDYPALAGADVVGLDVSSGVLEQPMSLEETVQGAVNRAKAAFQQASPPTKEGIGGGLSIGIEAGLVEVPQTKTGRMNVQVCAIYDGKDVYLGLSSGFELPYQVVEMATSRNMTIDQAAYQVGITDNPAIGKAEGLISIFTAGRLKRLDLIKQAVQMALIHVTL